MVKCSIPAKPFAFEFDTQHTAILAIDLQKDFLEPDGFGAEEGGSAFDSGAIASLIANVKDVFDAARNCGVEVIHTRVGHAPDLGDLAFHKTERQKKVPGSEGRLVIGDRGPKGRMLVRGEENQKLVDRLASHPGEIVIDKTGTGAFYDTPLEAHLQDRQITHLVIVGCTTECCVTSTLREANDRGYDCCVLTPCVSGFLPPDGSKACIDLISFSNGLFGFTSDSKHELIQQLSVREELGNKGSVMIDENLIGDIPALKNAYRSEQVEPLDVARFCYDRIQSVHATDASVFVHIFDWADISAQVKRLLAAYPDRTALPPLFGVPYIIKDNIDVAGVPTTCACPTLGYVPTETATCVRRLEAAGAILLAKSNMDQFATGLVGMRSPYGKPSSVYSSDHIAGGSSSGSAVAIGKKLASFALGTDTAASVRVPAAFNGVVGWKPTRGSSSIHGVIPASPSLDCVSIFAQDVQSTWKVWVAIRGYDERDLYSDPAADGPRLATRFAGRFVGRALQGRAFTFATPPEEILDKMCRQYQEPFARAVAAMERLGGRRLPNFNWRPFEHAQKELYGSARMAERAACLHDFFQRHGIEFDAEKQMHPITCKAVHGLKPDFSAAAAFEVMAVLRQLNQDARRAWRTDAHGKSFDAPVDVILTPTVPFHPKKSAVEEEPLSLNGQLGVFSQAVNLLDMCALAVPFEDITDAGFSSGKAPFSVQLIADKWEDGFLLTLGDRLMKATTKMRG